MDAQPIGAQAPLEKRPGAHKQAEQTSQQLGETSPQAAFAPAQQAACATGSAPAIAQGTLAPTFQ